MPILCAQVMWQSCRAGTPRVRHMQAWMHIHPPMTATLLCRQPHAETAAAAAAPQENEEQPSSPSAHAAGAADDLMQLKRKAAPPQALAQAPAAAQAPPEAQPKKRRKLRIAAAKPTGSRVVFDEGGSQLAPLERLGHSLEPGCAACC